MSKRKKQVSRLNQHHRKPKSLGGGRKGNLSTVCIKQHAAWHFLFQNYHAHRIAEIINAVWLDPDFEFIVIERRTTCT